MNNEDVLQRNDAGELEIRTAPSTGDTSTNKDDVYTRDAQGRLCVRTTGGGGGGGGTGTVTSVNGVQPVDGNVEITGDNITATVGEEEATITQHLTTLKNDEAELGEQVQENQGDINTIKIDTWPTSADYSPKNLICEANRGTQAYLSCNLGELEDGEYEFYFKQLESINVPTFNTKNAGWQQWLVHFTIKDGDFFGADPYVNNSTYCSPAPWGGAVGNAGGGYATEDNYLQIYAGKVENSFYIECGNFIFVSNNTSEQIDVTPVYVTKIKNVNTGEFIDMQDVSLLGNQTPRKATNRFTTVTPWSIDFDEKFEPYLSTVDVGSTMLNHKYIYFTLYGFLSNYKNPSSDYEDSFGKKAIFCFFTIPESDNFLEFEIASTITDFKVSNVKKGGIFEDVIFGNYFQNSAFGCPNLVLSKADGTNFILNETCHVRCSWYGVDKDKSRIQANYEQELPENFVLVGNVTPETTYLPNQTGNAGKFLTTDGTNASWGEVQPAAITTDATLTGTGTADSPLGISTATMATINGKQAALTTEQLAAVNSGITSATVASYDAYAGEISAKVNIAQGAENAGKILSVGADGNVVPVVAPNSGAATLLYYDSTQAPDHSHAMSGVSLDDYGLAGYEVYSNGYVRQWGQDSTSTGTTLVTLPISYTAATTVSMSFFVSVTEVAAEPTGQISAIPVAANQFQVDKPSAICNWETSGYITLS